jgi:hypothetical protein
VIQNSKTGLEARKDPVVLLPEKVNNHCHLVHRYILHLHCKFSSCCTQGECGGSAFASDDGRTIRWIASGEGGICIGRENWRSAAYGAWAEDDAEPLSSMLGWLAAFLPMATTIDCITEAMFAHRWPRDAGLGQGPKAPE